MMDRVAEKIRMGQEDAEMLADRIVYNNLNDNIDNVVENVLYWYEKILRSRQDEK